MEKKKSTDNVLFGDYFGQRADYSHGLFYGGHRRYLNTNGMSSLEPPNEFKSKRQLKMLRLSRQGNSRDERMFQVNFQSKKEDVDLDLIAQKKVKKVFAYVRDTLVFDHYSSTHPADWMEETQAGVQMWVNRNTGEVSPICPWLQPEDEKAQQHRDAPESKDAEEAEGTGSLVYDGSELQDLFALLGHGDDSSRRS